ncbi:efflux RND transporter periplasmic adaptor subunit [Dissulfurirhabdus thermomarina]|uniref:Efflux RND transporter periplasmic adaptor subunit n=1 Tax=Dissulfurirhabdus thermomarina TaxID=1765737 RepID=A0A6N9TMW1_DISTH|nr:efflux RND transporter periplasmic adaptor subunit [Dissulfurirhabdus thermomarina]NDY42622.1 efflux RND transporter periplasmic adaptor subunit [Dissulfurirhabdus thermomarina]NMX23061.1 efflux RND transporter periplasmic adaptor subunit [Dissulfurirhabdus thermomarina]
MRLSPSLRRLSDRRLLLSAALVAAFLIGLAMGGRTPGPATPAPTAAPAAGTIWTCAMHPQIRLPAPGKCPICGMDLIPLRPAPEKEAPLGPRQIRLSPEAVKLAEIQTAPVERRPVDVEIRLFGKIAYDETRLATIASWVAGRIDRLYVDFTGTTVQRGQPMVGLYSPELLSAQEELLQALETYRSTPPGRNARLREDARRNLEAVREKLRLWGLTPGQVREIERRGAASDHVTILAPLGGVVIHKNAVEGLYVKTGTPIYTIADLSRVWIRLDAYEKDLAWVHLGQDVEFRVEARPGERFHGTVTFVDPYLDEQTRTVRLRVEAPNPGGRLRPGMLVHAVVRARLPGPGAGAAPPVVIPASAPLLTGKRAVVYVAVPGRPGVFEGREVVLGPRAGEFYVVREGLHPGERVVTNGNFKIDSALQIQARPSMMNPEGGGPAPGHMHGGSGTKHEAAPPGAGGDAGRVHEGSGTKAAPTAGR